MSISSYSILLIVSLFTSTVLFSSFNHPKDFKRFLFSSVSLQYQHLLYLAHLNPLDFKVSLISSSGLSLKYNSIPFFSSLNFALNDIEDNFNKFLDKEKNKLTKVANNKYKEELLNTDIDNVEFKKVKVNIKLGAVDNIFTDGDREVQAYTIDNRHYIIKNWGSWHIYNDIGQDLWNSKTTDKLEVAKKQLVKWLKEIQNKNKTA